MNLLQKASVAAIPLSYYIYQQVINDRLRFEGISWHRLYSDDPDKMPEWVEDKGFRQLLQVIHAWGISGGHSGDEYGNCTLYFRCPLFGVVWWFPTGHYQTEVEVPEPGVNKWVDKVEYNGCDEYCKHDD